MPLAPVNDLTDKLKTNGVGTDLSNNFHLDNVVEINRAIVLIAEHRKKSGLKVVLLGEVLQSVALFETNYVLYEQEQAKRLQSQDGFGRLITEAYLCRQKRDLLVEVSRPMSPAVAYL